MFFSFASPDRKQSDVRFREILRILKYYIDTDVLWYPVYILWNSTSLLRAPRCLCNNPIRKISIKVKFVIGKLYGMHNLSGEAKRLYD